MYVDLGTMEGRKERACKCGNMIEKDINNQYYCRTCRAEYNHKYYIDKLCINKFIYFIVDEEDSILYIGSCKSKYRPIYHLKGLTHLETEPEDWKNLSVSKIRYIDVMEIVSNDAERIYIESLYIKMYEPTLNESIPKPDVDIETMEKLEDIVYNEYVEFEELDIKKATSYDGEVTFNYKDLILM